jgi:hypothetical protein
MTAPSDTESAFALELNEDIIERHIEGEPSLWLWVQTCPLEDCPCRSALVVVAKDRTTLELQANVVRDVWDDADDEAAFKRGVAASDVAVNDLVAFELDIDSGEVAMPLSESEELSPEVAAVASFVDGELLDHLASLWYRGKEQEDTTQKPIEPSQLKDYQVGQLIAWDEVYEGARMDAYCLEQTESTVEAEAIDTYCVRPGCECNEVHVQFYELGKEEAGFIGTVAVKLEEPVRVTFSVDENRRSLLEALWSKYQQRYSNWTARLAARADKMQLFGERLNRKSSTQPKKLWVSSSRKRNAGPKR